jgi:hypothetical protein
VVAKKAAFCGTAKNTVLVRVALNCWFYCPLGDFKKAVENAKKLKEIKKNGRKYFCLLRCQAPGFVRELEYSSMAAAGSL